MQEACPAFTAATHSEISSGSSKTEQIRIMLFDTSCLFPSTFPKAFPGLETIHFTGTKLQKAEKKKKITFRRQFAEEQLDIQHRREEKLLHSTALKLLFYFPRYKKFIFNSLY